MQPQGIQRRLAINLDESLIARFWHKVQKVVGSGDECWQWMGAQRNGYGAIKHNHKVLSAHVVSWVIHAKSQVPDGHIITHNCDNRICVNPGHLSAGTTKSNAQEMYDRCAFFKPRGEMVANHVLTDDLVRLIWAYRITYGYGTRRIHQRIGLTLSSIEGVIHHDKWAHVAKPTAEQAREIVAIHQQNFRS